MFRIAGDRYFALEPIAFGVRTPHFQEVIGRPELAQPLLDPPKLSGAGVTRGGR